MNRQGFIIKRITSVMLTFALIVSVTGLAVSETDAYAASSAALAASGKAASVKLSAKSASLDIGVSKTLKLKNAPGKVKWTSSNKKIASVASKRGKYGSVITVKGRKAGTCTVTAKCSGKKYKCKVTVSSVKIRKLSSSSVEKSSGYKFRKSLGKTGTGTFNIAVADFSFGLLRQASGTEQKDNILISPDSILTALVMAENGARGNTLKEMRTVLGGGISLSDFNSYLAGLNNRLCSSDRMIYQQANSLWVRKGTLQLRKSFLKKNKQYHNAQVYEAPFSSKTVRDINNWVFNNSRNMISNIISRLTPDDRMVIVNTTAFEGKWQVPFGSPRKDDFTSYDGSTRKVKMLADTGSYRYISLKGGTGFAKEYAAGSSKQTVSFVGLLPPEGMSVDQYAGSITGSDWIRAWKKRSMKNLRIKVPQFSYDYAVSLEDPLYNMGIHDAFTGKADFSGINSDGEQLQIDAVLHKTHIELNKNGTKAAAATAVVMKANSVMIEEPAEVFLDRPFLYALVDNKTGIPLFIGILYSVK